ncbi:unnamed protein product [Pleuronectes platessa]|uniref:Uncharacterized protein n=1 Tax=Pleuronectes platessa TaxID=8262 RepID=A0A9N7YNL1_PLEPL|nr:unnamed protein product [Pleuronectes platessa]
MPHDKAEPPPHRREQPSTNGHIEQDNVCTGILIDGLRPCPCAAPRPISSAGFDLAWLMNHKPVKARVCDIVELCRWLSTLMSAGSAALQRAPEGSPLSRGRSCTTYSQLLVFRHNKRSIHSVTNLPRHDKYDSNGTVNAPRTPVVAEGAAAIRANGRGDVELEHFQERLTLPVKSECSHPDKTSTLEKRQKDK